MLCKKCKKEIPDGSVFCNFCGKKQTVTAARHRKRAHGTGTIRKDTRYKNPYIAIAPSTPNGSARTYIGSYPDMKSAQAALEDYIKHGRPELYNATLADIYQLWSSTHFKQIKDSTVISAMWKRLEPIHNTKMYQLWSSTHFKQIKDSTVISAMWKRLEPIHNTKMSEIRTAHFQPFVDAATSQSAASKIKSLAIMLCRYAMENDLVNKNYAEFIKLPKFKKSEKIIFTADQINTLWKHSTDKRVQVILAMIYMGFRLGEILSLTPRNIHLDEGYIIGGIKTEAGTNRVIPFPQNIPEIAEFFRQWIADAEPEQRLFMMDEKQFRHTYFYQPLCELGMINGHLRPGTGNSWVFPDKHHLTPHSTISVPVQATLGYSRINII